MPAAGFTDDLHTRWMPSEGLWEITRTFEFHSGHEGAGLFVRCEAGMVSDLASVPLAARWLIPKAGKNAQAAVIHDRCYADGFMLARVEQAEKRIPVSRGMADAMMYQAMRALDVAAWRREAIFRALQVGGFVAWNRYRRKGYGFATETTR